MIDLRVDPRSVDQTIEYLAAVRLRIFEQVKLGMKEAMDALAGTAVVEMTAAGIQPRSGELASNIVKSARVAEGHDMIWGSVSAKGTMKLKGRTFLGHLGTALDEGYTVPPIDGNLFRFTDPDEATLFRRGHAAFDVKPHPFLKQASDSFAPTLIDIIAERVKTATEATA